MAQKKKRPARRPECDRAISPEQAARFLLAMRNGATVKLAAAAARVPVATLYYRRRIDAEFAGLWRDAVAGASEDAAAARGRERAAKDAAQGMVVRDRADGLPVRKRRRAVEFTRTRRQTVLDHMAGGCNMAAAAAAAGVTERTVRKALAADSEFAEAFDAALAVGYKGLEAEAISQQQEAHRAFRLDPTVDPAEGGRTFERTMHLLHEYRRRDGSIGRRPSPHHLKSASKEQLVAALDKLFDMVERRQRALGRGPDV